MALYLGLDFGGTKLAAGLADDEGRVIAFWRCPTNAEGGPEAALAAMRDMVASGTQSSASSSQLAAVGISFGGPVNSRRTHTVLSHHGPGWEDYPLVDRVASIWGCPVAMDNDANAAALGEYRFGAGQGCRDLLYVTVSTGIGAGIVIDGKLYQGTHGLAGEVGHTIVVPNGPLCPCGKRGCLEAVASGPSIARAYAEREGIDQRAVTAADVFRRAAAGDVRAEETLNVAIEILGIGLANAINILDPDAVVVGGGVTGAGERFFAPLRTAVRAHCAPSAPDSVPIVPAKLGDHVGVLGAIALVAPRA